MKGRYIISLLVIIGFTLVASGCGTPAYMLKENFRFPDNTLPIVIPIEVSLKPSYVRLKSVSSKHVKGELFTQTETSYYDYDIKIHGDTVVVSSKPLGTQVPWYDIRMSVDKNGKIIEKEVSFPALLDSGVKKDSEQYKNVVRKVGKFINIMKIQIPNKQFVKSGESLFTCAFDNFESVGFDILWTDDTPCHVVQGWNYYKGEKVLVTKTEKKLRMKFNDMFDMYKDDKEKEKIAYLLTSIPLDCELLSYAVYNPENLQIIKIESVISMDGIFKGQSFTVFGYDSVKQE